MTPEQQLLIQETQGSLGWQLIDFIIQEKMKQLDTVTTIDERSVDKAGIEALSRKKSVVFLREFLSDIGFFKTLKQTNQTYE